MDEHAPIVTSSKTKKNYKRIVRVVTKSTVFIVFLGTILFLAAFLFGMQRSKIAMEENGEIRPTPTDLIYDEDLDYLNKAYEIKTDCKITDASENGGVIMPPFSQDKLFYEKFYELTGNSLNVKGGTIPGTNCRYALRDSIYMYQKNDGSLIEIDMSTSDLQVIQL